MAPRVDPENPDDPDSWAFLDGASGPSLAVDTASVGSDVNKALVGEWVTLADPVRQDVRIRGVILGGDDDAAKVIGIARVDLDLVAQQIADVPPPETTEPPADNPGSCDTPGDLDAFAYADQAAAFAAWIED